MKAERAITNNKITDKARIDTQKSRQQDALHKKDQDYRRMMENAKEHQKIYESDILSRKEKKQKQEKDQSEHNFRAALKKHE